MPILHWIPWLDLFLGVLFLGLIALGFALGLLKEVWLILSAYLGAVLASLYGDLVGAWFQAGLHRGPRGAGTLTPVASVWGFFIVLLVVAVLFYSILHSLTKGVRLPATLLLMDKLGGVFLGAVSSFFLTIFAALILNALLLNAPSLNEWAFLVVLKAQRPTSPLLHLFLASRGALLALLQPLLPAGLPYFLSL
ncbi:MAG: CvpA family protein [Chloroflexia bacterium]